ncbi:zinc finger, CCHC-type containing protein [Tanacetum coccineum]
MTIGSILLEEKLTGSNFTNWYHNLRIVLGYKKKIMFVEQPTGPAPDLETTDPDIINKYYETVNLEQEVTCLMMSSMSPDLQKTLKKYNAYDMLKELKTMFKEQAKQELFKTGKTFHACKQEEDQSVSSYLLNMKSYLGTLECLGYVIPNKLGTIAELHAMLKLHEKGILKKAETPAVLAIREGKIQKDKKKPKGEKVKEKGKNKLAYAPKPKIPPLPKRDNPAKDSVCHHCKELGHWRRNCSSYQAELKKRKNASVDSTSGIFTIELYAFPNKTWVYDTGCGTHICNTSRGLRGSRMLKHKALSLYMGNGISVLKDNVFYFNAIPRDGYPKETMAYYFYYPLENKIFVARNAEFFENSLMVQEASGSHGLLESSGSDRGLEFIQDEDTQPSENTSEIDMASMLMLLGDLNKPPNYKATLSDLEFYKWIEAMNTEMHSMKDNQVWVLVDLPPNGRTIRSKWIFKKKTDMDGTVHTFKARLIAKGYTQTHDVDYGETFSPVADIRAIRILLAIVAFYDYEIWKMDVKTAFLNGHLSEDVYMVQPEGRFQQNPGEIHRFTGLLLKLFLSYLDNDFQHQQHQDERIYDAWTRFKYLIQRVPHHGLDLWSFTQFFYDHVDNYTRMDLDFAADGDLKELSSEEAWETIDRFAQVQKEWDKPFKAITEQELAGLRAQTNELFGDEKTWFEMPRCIAWDKVDNPSP